MKELIQTSERVVKDFLRSKERQESEQEVKEVVEDAEERARQSSSHFRETTRTVILSGALQGNWDIEGSLKRLEGEK